MSTTITLDAAVLERVLANGILFACKDDTLPSLVAVRFDWDGDTLYAVATNRYVLSREQVEYHGDGNTEGRDAFSIGTSDAKRVISMLKTVRLARFPVSVKYDNQANMATFTVDGNTLTASTEHSQFPEWRRLMSSDDSGQAMKGVTIGAQWLGLLAKVKAGKGSPVRFGFNGAKPVRAEIGEHFKAVIVPIREAVAAA